MDLYIKDRSLRSVERFVFGWVLVFVLGLGLLIYQGNQLASYYLTEGPEPGGRFTEGIVGEVGGVNPIFPGDRVSRAAEQLIFSSLFKREGKDIVPDLATGHEVNDSETVFTVDMRDDAYWHDGSPVTSEDVVFTFRTIQNPDVGSSLRVMWQDIKIKAVDDYTVEFVLPNPYAPFLSQLTTNIAPKHILSDVDNEKMRVTNFNQNPIGSGPFEFDGISDQEKINFKANADYYGSKPKLDRFTIATFENQNKMVTAYNRGELSSMNARSELDTSQIDNQDKTIMKKVNKTGQAFAFYNTKKLKDARLRKALTFGINKEHIINNLSGNHDIAHGPLLPEHLGYKNVEKKFNKDKSEKLLKQTGRSLNQEGFWQRNGEVLSIEITTQETAQYKTAASELAEQWRELGVDAKVKTLDSTELQQSVIRPRDFDVLLFGVVLGEDPDAYAYWHSSQTTDTGRNLSQYESSIVDESLEDGRTITNNLLRAAKYKTFQDEWASDTPAVALYRLYDYYIYRKEARGIKINDITDTDNRFHNVEDWTINISHIPRRLNE